MLTRSFLQYDNDNKLLELSTIFGPLVTECKTENDGLVAW